MNFLVGGINLIFLGGALVLGFLQFGLVDELQFMSAESQTMQGDPVFNRIRHFSEGKNDIWMMNQSHHGPLAGVDEWDRLAIVIDRKSKTARFLQIKPGDLVWSADLLEKQVPYRASCFMCHSNGLRAIRPVSESIGWREKATVLLWNFKIKSYGRVTADPVHSMTDTPGTPFRHRGSIDNDVLKAPKCVMCHRDVGLFARGSLVRQNSITIRFMIDSGSMPPLGITLTEKEKKEISRFTNGI